MQNVVPLPVKSRPLLERSDDELMTLAGTGARDAFELLVRRHGTKVVRFCARQTGSVEAGEEIAQDVWVSIWANRATFVAQGKFFPWLYSNAKNRLRNRARDRGRAGAVIRSADDSQEINAAEDKSPQEIDRLLARERQRRVNEVLASLPEHHREAAVLRFSEELPYEDIARILDVNESTARSRVFYALKELRHRLNEGGGAP